MKAIQTLSYACDSCNGYGYIYWGGSQDYAVEKCQCSDGSLFTEGENL